jgi:hypothetical protein
MTSVDAATLAKVILRGPAVGIIFGHAPFGELLQAHIGARGGHRAKYCVAERFCQFVPRQEIDELYNIRSE